MKFIIFHVLILILILSFFCFFFLVESARSGVARRHHGPNQVRACNISSIFIEAACIADSSAVDSTRVTGFSASEGYGQTIGLKPVYSPSINQQMCAGI